MGDKRVGIARGSSSARIAQPLRTLAASNAIDELAELARQNQADAVVVGRPRSLDGHETRQTQYVRHWVKAAQTSIRVPFYWQDEALTSVIARRRGVTGDVDAEAAAIILQDFLDSPPEQRVRC